MVIKTVFTAMDAGINKTFKRMGASAKRFGREASQSFRRASRSASNFRSVLGGVLGAGMISRGFSLVAQGVRSVTTEFLAFDDAITAAAAKFDGIERGSVMFERLKKTAREVGAVTEYTSAQAAEGLRFLAKAGWAAEDAMVALPSFVNLATASEMEFSRAADIATDVLGAFRLTSEDTTQQLTNLIRVNDVMSKAVNSANIDMEDLFETIKMAGPVATTAGISIEKFSAIAAFLGGAGIKGSLAGTAMRTMITNLAARTPQATQALRDLGISVQFIEKNVGNPIKMFEQFRLKLKNLTPAQKIAAEKIIFGKRAIAGASVAISGGVKALGKLEDALNRAGGSSERMAELMRQSVSKRLETMKSAAIEVGFKFIDAFEDKIPGGIDAATEAIRNFDVQPIVDAVNRVSDFVKIYGRSIKTATKFLLGLVVAQKAFNLAAKMNPYVIIVTGILGWITAIKELREEWTFLKNSGIFDWFGTSLAGASMGGPGAGFAYRGGMDLAHGNKTAGADAAIAAAHGARDPFAAPQSGAGLNLDAAGLEQWATGQSVLPESMRQQEVKVTLDITGKPDWMNGLDLDGQSSDPNVTVDTSGAGVQ